MKPPTDTLVAVLCGDTRGEMTAHGGRRPGAGRKPRAGVAGRNITVRLSEAESAELLAGLRDGETISHVLREGGLRLVRARGVR